MTTIVACANCDWKGHPSYLNPPQNLWQRVQPGEIVPHGDCPRCGAFCYPEGKTTEEEMFGLLMDSFVAWEGEEDSVKEEHAEHIQELSDFIDRYKATPI